jgi:uncharacterized membrane protein
MITGEIRDDLVASAGGRPDRARSRLWEIDLGRTLAITMMVAYHTVYDLELLSPGLGPDPFTGTWGALPEATGSLFLFVAGVSFAVSDERMRARGLDAGRRRRRHARRAVLVLGAAMVVSVATWVAFDERYVRFGILHAIAVGTAVCAVTIRLRAVNLVLGLAVIALGVLVTAVDSGSSWLLPIGLGPPEIGSVDYWPLLPWLGPMLIGVAVGTRLYPAGVRSRFIAPLGRRAVPGPLTTPGRHSLMIYLVHQLVLIPLVWTVLVVGGVEVPWPL